MKEKEITERIVIYSHDIKDKGGKDVDSELIRELCIQLFSINLRLYHLTERLEYLLTNLGGA